MRFWRSLLGKLDGWTTWGDSGLPDEATAFLEGRLLEQLRATGAGGRTPPWLWLNAVAHGDREVVATMADRRRPSGGPVAGWRDARSALAQELLVRSGGDERVMRELQRRALVPLEQSLSQVADLTPARLVEISVQEMLLAQA
jgi:hypothetical protein